MALPVARGWQKAQIVDFTHQNLNTTWKTPTERCPVWVTVAGTGTGKTHATGFLIKEVLKAAPECLVVVCCPLQDVKEGWRETLDVDPDGDGFHLACDDKVIEIDDDTSVFVTSYAGLSSTLELQLAKQNRPLIVVLDEFHRIEESEEDGNGWSGAVKSLVEKHDVRQLFCLTATPWREGNGSKLPYVIYDADDLVVANFTQTYSDELGATLPGVVEACFRATEAKCVKRSDGKETELDTQTMPDYLPGKSAKHFGLTHFVKCRSHAEFKAKAYLRNMLNDANAELGALRHTHGTTKGLVICESIDSAVIVHEYLLKLDPSAKIVSSRDRNPAGTIKAFRTDSSAWLVSVGMVSEGVNVKPIKVIVDFSNYLTLRDIIQRWGRSFRACEETGGIQAKIYFINHSMLRYVAEHIKQEMAKAKKDKKDRDGEGPAEPTPAFYSDFEGENGGAISDGSDFDERVAELADWMIRTLYEGMTRYRECLQLSKLIVGGVDSGRCVMPEGYTPAVKEAAPEMVLSQKQKRQDAVTKSRENVGWVAKHHRRYKELNRYMTIGEVCTKVNTDMKSGLLRDGFVCGTTEYNRERGKRLAKLAESCDA